MWTMWKMGKSRSDRRRRALSCHEAAHQLICFLSLDAQHVHGAQCPPTHFNSLQMQPPPLGEPPICHLTSSKIVSPSIRTGRWPKAARGARSGRPFLPTPAPWAPPPALLPALLAPLLCTAAPCSAPPPALASAAAVATGPSAAAGLGGGCASRTLTPCRLMGSSKWPLSSACQVLLQPLPPPPLSLALTSRTARREMRSSRTGPCSTNKKDDVVGREAAGACLRAHRIGGRAQGGESPRRCDPNHHLLTAHQQDQHSGMRRASCLLHSPHAATGVRPPPQRKRTRRWSGGRHGRLQSG